MNAEDFFCPKCRRIKSRCICEKISTRQKNLEILEKYCRVRELRRLFDTEDEIVIYRRFNPEEVEKVDLNEVNLSKRAKSALLSRGIRSLYRFQVEAIEKIKEGKNVVIVAPTGFGKTEAFIIPILESLRKGEKALVFYPTKALASDQYEKISFYSSFFGFNAIKFDGDSGYEERREVLSGRADIILTNPDMVDYHLRNTPAFRRVAEKVRFLVFDELHSYSGLLGSNVAWLVKRLERFSDFKVIASTATIANPKEFAEYVFGKKFEVVKSSGRKGTLHFIMRYTPSFYGAVKDCVKSLLGKKTLVFANSYKAVETIAWILNREGVVARVHKGGLTKKERRKVEREFKEGRVKVVVATSTLELGIDIGDVEAVVSELVPFPQFLQRCGRAGRKGQESVGVLILREDDSIANYYKNNPEEYFKDEMFCYAEKDNEELKRYHILSMAKEKAIFEGEVENLEEYVKEGYLADAGGIYLATRKAEEFLKNFNMRGIGERVKILLEGKEIGERTLPMAIKELFPGGIVIHAGRRVRSLKLDLTNFVAEVEPYEKGEEITDPLYTSIPRIIREIEEIEKPVNAIYCDMDVTISVFGYIVKNVYTGEKVGINYLDEPVSYTFRTKGFLFSSPFPDYLDYEDFYAGSFHALEHVLIEASNSLTGGGSNYMGGISTPEGDIFVYDATPGGNGLSKLLFSRLEKAFRVAYEVLNKCNCKRVDGCPKCTYSYQCGNNNQPLNRLGAINAIEKIFRGEKRKTDVEKYKEVAEFRYFP